MTVKELIEALKKEDKDKIVAVYADECGDFLPVTKLDYWHGQITLES